jgi:N utilization substance protein A
MVNPFTSGGTEIIQIADAVAKDKGIQRHIILEAMEHAIEAASKKKYGYENNIKASINQKTGEIKIFRERAVVEEVTDLHRQISLEDAKIKNNEAKIGDVLSDQLPPMDIIRVAAQSAKQVIVQKVREAEREKQYEEYQSKQGEIINGIVKRVEFGNVIVDLGRGGEAMLKRENIIRGEMFKVNDRVRAYIAEVNRDNKSYQVVLSRVHDKFLEKLFAQEVPEIYDGLIEIKNVARDPGSKSKIAVYTRDSNVDPVGACVGVRGSRIQNIVNELRGEKIDIIKWTEDPAKYVINALSPAAVAKVIIDEDEKRMEVAVPEEQLSLAIGKRGQNVRLASKLIGWHIDILTEEEESKKRVEEFNISTQLFMGQLGLEEVLARLLAAEGFVNLDDMAYVAEEELAAIEGIDIQLAKQLISRAQKIVTARDEKTMKELEKLGVDSVVIDFFESLSLDQVLKLAHNGIKKIEDIAELSLKEFKEILPNSGLTDEEINHLLRKVKKA